MLIGEEARNGGVWLKASIRLLRLEGLGGPGGPSPYVRPGHEGGGSKLWNESVVLRLPRSSYITEACGQSLLAQSRLRKIKPLGR